MMLYKTLYTTGEKLDLEKLDVDRRQHRITTKPDVKLTISQDKGLGDGFRLTISKHHRIEIVHDHERGLDYAFELLASMSPSLTTGLYENMPDFAIRGIIEGFYGPPWSHEDRLDVMVFSQKMRLNAYFYAPKDDLWHRDLWREPYPADARDRLLELVRAAKAHHVDFYFCISPGKDFDYTDETDEKTLHAKIDSLVDHGVRHFALLLDDIDYDLDERSQRLFQRPGLAHAHISNQLHRHLKQTAPDHHLVMCPTEYWQNWDTPYRQDLREHLDGDIAVFWTGFSTIAEYIPDHDGFNAKKWFGHPLILWDNYPVNDVEPYRLFLGPLRNRGPLLGHSHLGMVSNPMVEWHPSKIAIHTMAAYMWDAARYDPDAAHADALKAMLGDHQDRLDDLKVFTDENSLSLISYDKTAADEAVEALDMDCLERYFKKTGHAFARLKASAFDRAFLTQVRPWLERFDRDASLFQKIRTGKVGDDDLAKLKAEKHALGSNIIVKLCMRLGLVEGPVHPKIRPNHWDLPEQEK